jgi:hypothetical protein
MIRELGDAAMTIDEANLAAINQTINDVIAENRERWANATMKLGLEPWPVPPPGATCPLCVRPMPNTDLEVWLAQNGESMDTLADRISADPVVNAFLIGRRHGQRVSKNLIWRLNHQDEGYTPRPGGVAAIVQAAMLEITGLTIKALQNERPSGGYACLAQVQR